MPLREFTVISLWALWLGGLTFYALIVVPIGGELRPELQTEVFSGDYETGTYAQDMDECIDQTSAT